MDPFLNELLGNGNDEFQASTKTEEEIKKLTLEENMTETKRTMHILTRGQPIQKISVYMHLDKILIEPEAFHKVLPLVSEDILNQNEENQIEAARSIRKLIDKKSLSQSHLVQIFQITCAILKIWNQQVLDEWVLVFNQLLKKLPYEVIARDCESTIMNLSEQSQHSLSKYVAVRLIGFIAENGIKNTSQLFDRARILCQDPDFEIRKILAEEVMLKICYNAGTELTESKYLEKIMELLYDSNINIKLAAIDAIVKVTDILSSDYKKTRMTTVFLELMNSINDEVMKKMSYHIGAIIYKLEDVLPRNSNQLNQMMNIYREWSNSKSSEMKKNVLYNLPYMIRFFDNKDLWKNLYLKALKDTNNKALRLIAISSFHEICKAFKYEELTPYLRDAFESLLRETDIDTVERIVTNLADLIMVFQVKKDENFDEDGEKGKEEEKEKDSKDKDKSKDLSKIIKDIRETTTNTNMSYLPEFLKLAENLKSRSLWRCEMKFINSINKCYDYFDIKELSEKYVNYLLDRVARGINEVQKLAVESLVDFLKRNYLSKRTNEIMKNLAANYYGAYNYQNRLAFVEIYNKMAERFSRRFFKAHNLNELLLKLGDDKVTVVRKRVLESVITVRKMLLPTDNILVIKLDETLNRARNDKNKIVAEVGKEAHKELKSLTQYFFAEFEEEDNKRMGEEDALKEKEIRDAEEAKKRQSDDTQRDKGDYLYAFSNMVGGAGRSKGSKKPTFKTDVGVVKPTKNPVTYNPPSLVTPKTRTSVGTSLPNNVPLSKHYSSPMTSYEDDTKAGITKPKPSPAKIGGTGSNGSNGSLSNSGNKTSLSTATSGTKISSIELDKPTPSPGKPTVTKPQVKGYGDFMSKSDPKSSTSNTKLPLTSDPINSDKLPKVPTIKKKI